MISFYFYYNFSFKKKLEKILRYEKSNFKKILYIFCNNKYISTLNCFVFKNTKWTDVITLKKTDRNKNKVGEIYINIEMIKFNSIVFKKTFYEELKRVMIHGVLHLIGYEDNNKQITEKETFYVLKNI
ncbi:rRNA maturation RNase YbeY [Candidatus Karelsulcia muelleri]|uniref:rRNA maturation RNase YbeY n=1 Tax=Candidatus Karelsulcia muelleri TaxID=336810 RepID=UPI00195156DE|nr:rRNA maturation RNase YbeY [Candidatus Karelsulcia muelleri]